MYQDCVLTFGMIDDVCVIETALRSTAAWNERE